MPLPGGGAGDHDRGMVSDGPLAALPPERVVLHDLLLRRWARGDATALHRAVTESYSHLHRWVGWASMPSTLAAQEDFLDVMTERWDTGQSYSYGIFDPSGATVIGSAGIYDRAGTCAGDITYWVHASQTGRGIAFACAAALTGIALRLPGVDHVEIHCDQANIASAAVARKLGYRLDRLRSDVRDAPAKSGQQMVWTMPAGSWVVGC